MLSMISSSIIVACVLTVFPHDRKKSLKAFPKVTRFNRSVKKTIGVKM